MRRLALEHFAAADRADEFSVAHRHFTAHCDQVRPAFDFPAFERAVIDIHLLRLRRDLSAIFRIVDDEVSVRADLDRAFARKQSEGLRRVCARDVDEGMQVELPGLYTMRVEQVHSIFDRRNSVWDLCEIIAAPWFLGFEIE